MCGGDQQFKPVMHHGYPVMLSSGGKKCKLGEIDRANRATNAREDIGNKQTWGNAISTIIMNTFDKPDYACTPDNLVGPLYTKCDEEYVKTADGMKKVKNMKH